MADETPQREGSPDLNYEETPIIDTSSGEVVSEPPMTSKPRKEDVVPEAAKVFQSHPTQADTHTGEIRHEPAVAHTPPPKPRGAGRHIGTILFIVILFGLGMWLSSQLRSFFATEPGTEVPVPTQSPDTRPTVAPDNVSTPSAQANGWVEYRPISGVTRQPVTGIAIRLPSDVKTPVCDSGSCASQGTNLPGGTRLTVALRGRGQLLPDFRGAILTDASGKEFTMQQKTVGGLSVYEYTGNFTGSTGGGYSFTAMRGVLIPVSDTLAVELNHFAPTGTTSDFATDDALFERIVATFTGSVTAPTATPAAASPTPTPAAF